MSTTDNITVFENLSDNIISFESKEQFMRYYDKNKDTIDNMATRGLNTKFKIDGFKIGRKNKQLILFPMKQSIIEHHSETNDCSEELNQLNMKIDILTDKINKLDNSMKQIFRLLSNLNPNSQSPSSYTSANSDIFARTGQNSYR